METEINSAEKQIPKEKLLNTIATKKNNIKDFDVIDLGFGDKSLLFDCLHFDSVPSQDKLLDSIANYLKAIDSYCRERRFNLNKDERINILVDVKPYMVKTLYTIIEYYAGKEAKKEKDNKGMSTKLVHKFIIHFPFYNKDGIITNTFSDITHV